ncbi:MAG: HipA domain-containing protein [Longicatena sp.]
MKDAREQLDNMLVVDYIMINEDRHLRNFGIIRNVETLEWIKVAPIYDTGQSLLSQTDYFDMNFNSGYGKFFTNVQAPFDKIIKC